MTLVIMQRKKIFVNTDPQKRCYDGCFFSYEYHWSAWEHFATPKPEQAEDSLAWWRELNAGAVQARGEGATVEYKLQEVDNG